MDPSSPASSSSTPAELKPKKPFLRRILPFLLVANFAVGAYVLLRTTKKESADKEEEVSGENVVSAPAESSRSEVPQQPPFQPAEVPKKVLPPVPEDEQRQLFKWILEEKRKVKPESSSEKKKLDEEKALLKQYIRAKSIPSL
uniref:Deneddylase UL48 n=2 Tax=Anthurium amnicola TaxID=1678845 RepID=A0A1D1ZJ61_9ARAE